MKKLNKIITGIAALAFAGIMSSCGEYKPTMTPDVPNLPTVSNLDATVTNRVVTVTWQYPTTSLDIEGVTLYVNNSNPVYLDKGVTSYSFSGMPMEVENLYTVKMRYSDGSSNYVSEGVTVTAAVPYEKLADVTSLEITDIYKRTATFEWTLPNASGITGVRVGLDGEDGGTIFPGADVLGGTVKGLKTGVDLKFRVQVQYDYAYYSDGEVINEALPYVPTKVGYLLLADNPTDLTDDDEQAAAMWFLENYVDTEQGDFITIPQLTGSEIDFDDYGVIWIEVDQVGLEIGWNNLPGGLAASPTIDALKRFGENGGNLYLTTFATQLTVPLGIVPEDMAPTQYNSNPGGYNPDVWTINPFIGPTNDTFYDRSEQEVFAGLTFDKTIYDWATIPLIGEGDKEDHNCMWKVGELWSNAGTPGLNAISWFEGQTNSIVLATWGQERSYNFAGMVDFKAGGNHGRCIAMGLAAYEFNQNSGENVYQENIEKLTSNVLNILK